MVNMFRPKRYYYLGAVATIVFMVFWLISVILTPEWEIFQDYPSDLGLYSSGGHVVFNIGMMIFGFTLAYYSFTMFDASKNFWFRIAFLQSIFAGISIACVGIFNEDFTYIHEMFSATTFTLSAMVFVYFGIYFVRTGRRNIGLLFFIGDAVILLSGLFMSIQAWDNMVMLTLGFIFFMISASAGTFRFWEGER